VSQGAIQYIFFSRRNVQDADPRRPRTSVVLSATNTEPSHTLIFNSTTGPLAIARADFYWRQLTTQHKSAQYMLHQFNITLRGRSSVGLPHGQRSPLRCRLSRGRTPTVTRTPHPPSLNPKSPTTQSFFTTATGEWLVFPWKFPSGAADLPWQIEGPGARTRGRNNFRGASVWHVSQGYWCLIHGCPCLRPSHHSDGGRSTQSRKYTFSFMWKHAGG